MKKFLRMLVWSIFLLPALAAGEGRLVKLVVPYEAGGNVDVIARLYAVVVGDLLKENWVIENKSGASGTIGGYFVARSAPDGATLMFVPDAHNLARVVVKNVPYDPLGDFTAIARVASAPLVFVVNPQQVQARNLSELAAEVKANPKKFSFAIGGLASSSRIGAEIFRSYTDTDILLVPYRSTSPAINGIVSGQVNLMLVAPLAAVPLIKSGRLRALAVTTPERFEVLPDVPTTAEAGMPEFIFSNSYGVWGPKDMPKEIVARISAAFKQAAANPEIRQKLLGLGIAPIWEAPEMFARQAASDLHTYGPILVKAGVTPQ